ncbi:acyl-CoA N-acyltransferase [Pavlovales sp. CCMP2436]|nr:acyl-CoA N-acyltransferase [Pavlovales sp. CCMP2436]
MREGWAVGLRLDGELVAFAAALPAALSVDGARVDSVEVSFLCVHAEHRGRRLTSVVLGELARRVAASGVRHAVYTSSSQLPQAVGCARFHHRPLRPRRLLSSGFVEIEPVFAGLYAARFATLRRTGTPGLRPLRAADVPEATALVNRLHSGARLSRLFSPAELAHAALPRRGRMAAYVVVCPESGRLRGLVSFGLSVARPRGRRISWPWRLLPIGRPSVRAATLQLFAVEEGVDGAQLLADVLVLAKGRGCDVLTALDTFQAGPLLRQLRFEEGDGRLRFHVYNYGLTGATASALAPRDPRAVGGNAARGSRSSTSISSAAEGPRGSWTLQPTEIALLCSM